MIKGDTLLIISRPKFALTYNKVMVFSFIPFSRFFPFHKKIRLYYFHISSLYTVCVFYSIFIHKIYRLLVRMVQNQNLKDNCETIIKTDVSSYRTHNLIFKDMSKDREFNNVKFENLFR